MSVPPIELTISDGEEEFILIATHTPNGIVGTIDQRVDGRRIDAYARTQYDPATTYVSAGECLLALMRDRLLPALGVKV